MENKKILLIDDERDFVKIMKKKIESWGYDFSSANGGASGIKALAKVKPDLIVLDLIMSEMDGLTALKEIRKIDKKIPIIMLTSHKGFNLIKEAEDLGVTAYVFKMNIDPNLRSLITGALK